MLNAFTILPSDGASHLEPESHFVSLKTQFFHPDKLVCFLTRT